MRKRPWASPGAAARQSGQAGRQAVAPGGSSEAGQQVAPGSYPGGGQGSIPGYAGSGSGGGPLTPAEQVAILDAQLEKGTGEFDAMILEEQRPTAPRRPPDANHRQTQSGLPGSGAVRQVAGRAGSTADAQGMAAAVATAPGGGMGGAGGGGGGAPPQDTAKYPPPKDIPSGNDDDVVARQLREAAMREPDPAVREKLWDEYRKYKGISQWWHGCLQTAGGVALWLLMPAGACVNQTIKSTSVPSDQDASSSRSRAPAAGCGHRHVSTRDWMTTTKTSRSIPRCARPRPAIMPNLLSQAMQDSGAWGAVRVVPDTTQITDLLVQGKILHSDGEELQLQITATDSRGYVWLDKKYTGNASRYAYRSVTTRTTMTRSRRCTTPSPTTCWKLQEELREEDRENVRLVTELLFARSFSPDAFDGYLEAEPQEASTWCCACRPRTTPCWSGCAASASATRCSSIPCRNITGLSRTRCTVPYQEWRKLSYQEAVALRELRAESTRNLIAGGVAVARGHCRRHHR